ncbi:hypothetical protein CL659_04885 [bacterium]|nr:hypothetical protein [bacterium]|tara:strand:- start:3299 stop:3772 length:474 start_codon:yes stop_codon:yes gene_type:complete
MSYIRELAKELIEVDLPIATNPVASYKSIQISSKGMLFVSGQLPMKDGELMLSGIVGEDLSIEEGEICARQCAINILSQLDKYIDENGGRVSKILQLTGFVACNKTFINHPQVINGASDFLNNVLGDAGQHSRQAVGVPSLPLNAPVEISAIVEINA